MYVPLLTFPVRLAQFAFEDLASTTQWKRSGDEFDTPRVLECGDETPTVGDQLLLTERLFLLAAHDRMDLLPPCFVGDTDDGTLCHGFVLVNRILNLSRVDVFSTADDHVF